VLAGPLYRRDVEAVQQYWQGKRLVLALHPERGSNPRERHSERGTQREPANPERQQTQRHPLSEVPRLQSIRTKWVSQLQENTIACSR